MVCSCRYSLNCTIRPAQLCCHRGKYIQHNMSAFDDPVNSKFPMAGLIAALHTAKPDIHNRGDASFGKAWFCGLNA